MAGSAELTAACENGDAARLASLLGDKTIRKHVDKPDKVGSGSTAADGRRPLHLAAENGSVDCVRLLLLRGGAKINAGNINRSTPLHGAVWKARTDVVHCLILHHADLNHRNAQGLTPLHIAAHHGHPDMAKLLIAAGCDTTIKDNNGWTPLEAAMICDRYQWDGYEDAETPRPDLIDYSPVIACLEATAMHDDLRSTWLGREVLRRALGCVLVLRMRARGMGVHTTADERIAMLGDFDILPDDVYYLMAGFLEQEMAALSLP